MDLETEKFGQILQDIVSFIVTDKNFPQLTSKPHHYTISTITFPIALFSFCCDGNGVGSDGVLPNEMKWRGKRLRKRNLMLSTKEIMLNPFYIANRAAFMQKTQFSLFFLEYSLCKFMINPLFLCLIKKWTFSIYLIVLQTFRTDVSRFLTNTI
jgi:hypothetical protein